MAKYTTDIEQDWFECYDESRHLESHGGIFFKQSIPLPGNSFTQFL